MTIDPHTQNWSKYGMFILNSNADFSAVIIILFNLIISYHITPCYSDTQMSTAQMIKLICYSRKHENYVYVKEKYQETLLQKYKSLFEMWK